MKLFVLGRRAAILLGLLAIAASSVFAVPVNITYTDAAGTGFFDNTPVTPVGGNNGTTLGAQRRNAFEAAVIRLGDLVAGTVAIEVRARFADLGATNANGSTTLANAGPMFYNQDFAGAPVAGTFYPIALANQIAGSDLNPSGGDIQVNCNTRIDQGALPGRSWYYGLDGAPPSGGIDFISTMLHEIAHGLGFLSFLNQDGSFASGAPIILDHFIENSGGTRLRNMTQASRASAAVSSNLFFDGPSARAQNGNVRPRIHAPGTWAGGSSMSHFDEATYSTAGSIEEMQTPSASFATHNIGTLLPGVFQDLGWSFRDGDPAGIVILTPAAGQHTNGLSASGTATDYRLGTTVGAVGLKEVRVVLHDAGGVFWNWTSSSFDSTTFTFSNHVRRAAVSTVPIATGDRSWSISLPASWPGGSYRVQASAVDLLHRESDYGSVWFVKDKFAEPPTIIDPAAGTPYAYIPTVTGTASDPAGIDEVRIALRRADGVWWSFFGGGWAGTNFENGYNERIATGKENWSATLPASLGSGTYQVHARTEDELGNVSDWAIREMVLDAAPPAITFSPLTNQQVVFNFERLGGTLSEAGTVKFKIEWFKAGANEFWNGVNWSSDGGNAALLNANVSGLNWTPAPGTLPARNQIAQAAYIIHVFATDTAGNTGSDTLALYRSPLDTTPPVVGINIDDGQVFTNNFLPTLSGLVGDPESGIKNVTMYFARRVPGGFEYWTGSTWGANATALPLNYNDPVWTMTVAQPSGSNLRNGGYNIQVIAENREAPSLSGSVSVNFTVDWHPVYTWTAGSWSDGDPNNNNDNWDNPANWSPYGMPPEEANVFVNGHPQARHLGAVAVYGLNHSGGTIYMSNLTVKFLAQSGGRLHLENRLQLADNGVFRWNAGELYGGGAKLGSFNVPTNGTVIVSNTAGKATYSITFNNSGTVRWYEGHIYGDESVINNGQTGLWEAHGPYVLNLYPNFGPGNRGFVNHGTFRKRGSVDTAHQGYFNNFGVLETEAGLFTVYDSMRWEDGSRITGGGTVRLVNGCCGAAATIAGNTTLEGTFELSEWNTYIRGAGLISLPSNAVLKVSAGYVGGNVNISGNGQIAWTGGGFDGTNTVWTYVNVSGNGTKYFNRNGNPQFTVMNNLGIINWSGSGVIHGWARGGWSEKPGTLNNYGEIRFLNDGTPFVRDGDYTTLNNFGTLVKVGGTNETTLHSFRVNNHARIVAETGTLALVDEVFLHTNSFLNGLSRIRLAGAITASNDVTASGLVRMDGGWFNCVTNTNGVALAKWSGTNTFEFAGGTLYGHHTFSNHVTFNITGNATKFLGSATTLDNYGRMTWSGTGRLFMWARSGWSEYPSRIHNRPGATFEWLTDGYPFQRDGDYSFFTNHPGALVVKTGGSNYTTIDSIQFANAGDVRANVGTNQFTDVLHMRPGGRFTGAGAHLISGGGHTLYGTNVIDGTTVQHSGGWITGNSNSVATLQTINNGLWTWSGGGIAERMAWAGTFDITGSATKQLGSGAVLNNSAYVRWSGLGHIWNQGRPGWNELPATWNNLPLAVFEALDDGVFSFDGSPCMFNNSALATFRKTGGTNTIVYWILNNAGNVQSLVGRIELAGGGSGTGTFLADNGARIKFTGGNYKLENALLTGQGLFQVDGATVTTAGNLGFGTSSSTTLELISGTINGAASFVGNPVVNWTGGSLAGTQHIAAGSVMNISGGRKFLASATVLNNQGTINWTGPGDLYAWARSGYSELPSTINNFAGATFRFLTDGTPFVRDGSYCTFNNYGTLVKSGGTAETTFHSFVLNNFGSVIAESGTLAFVDYANFNAGSQLNGQSRIRFAGLITANNMVMASGLVRMDGGWFNAETNANGTPMSAWFGTNTFEWVGGTLYGHHTWGVSVTCNIADPGATAVTKYLGSFTKIDNHGTMNWSGQGRIHAWARGGYTEYPSIINNRPGATFRFLNDGWPFIRDGDYSRFTNHPGALVLKTGGTNRTTIDSFQFANSGEVRAEVGTIEFSDVLHLQDGGVLSGSGAHLISGGNHSVRGTTTVNSQVRMENGTVTGSAGATLGGGTGSFEWTGGYLGGEFTFGAGLKSRLSGGNTKAFSPGAVIHNAGEILWSGGDLWSPGRGGYGETPIHFHNASGATFVALGNNAFTTWERAHTFSNAAGATFIKSNAVGTTTCNWSFQNAGAMELHNGTLALNIHPTPLAGGKVRFSIGGLNAGTDYGRLTLAGAAALAGDIHVSLRNGFAPTNGNTFTLMNYGSRSGQFANAVFAPLPPELRWNLGYGATALTLSVFRPHHVSSPTALGNGNFQFTISGAAATRAMIDASVDLNSWQPIFTNAPFNGTLTFEDAAAANFTNRFYRIRIEP